MSKVIGRIATALAGLALLAVPATAQMIGNPVYVSPKHGPGLSINADFGRGLNDESGKSNYFGARATLGVPMVSFTVGAGSVNPEGALTDAEITFGGNVTVNVLSAPMLPVSLSIFGGAGYEKSGEGAFEAKLLNVPVGAALAFSVPSPALSVEPWVAPRVEIARVSFGGESQSQIGFGASAGLNIGIPSGLGFHAALEWMTFSEKTSGTLNLAERKPLMAGIGVHYKFSIPGLGMVPGM